MSILPAWGVRWFGCAILRRPCWSKVLSWTRSMPGMIRSSKTVVCGIASSPRSVVSSFVKGLFNRGAYEWTQIRSFRPLIKKLIRALPQLLRMVDERKGEDTTFHQTERWQVNVLGRTVGFSAVESAYYLSETHLRNDHEPLILTHPSVWCGSHRRYKGESTPLHTFTIITTHSNAYLSFVSEPPDPEGMDNCSLVWRLCSYMTECQ